MARSVRSIIWLLIMALTVSACGLWPFAQSDVAEAAEGMVWLTDEECAAFELATDRVLPLEPVELVGWPDPAPGDHGLVLARVFADGDDPDTAPTVVVPTWYQPLAVPAPVHPSGDLEGGPLQIQIGQFDDDETRWCDQHHDLEIAPLPAALPEQGLVAQLELLDEILEAVLIEHATDGPTLAQHPIDTLPEELLPAYLLAVLLHDDTKGIVATVEGLTGDEQELADRLVARVQTETNQHLPTSVVSTDGSQLETSEEGPTSPFVEGAMLPNTAGDVGNAGQLATAAPTIAPIATSSVMPRSFAVAPDPETAPAQAVNQGEVCIATNFADLATMRGRQISGDTMAGGSTGFTIEAAMFVGGLPIIGRVGLPTVLVAWATKFTATYLQGMLPSQWERTDFETSPPELFEDDVDGGYLESITLRYRSEGWDMGPLLSDLLMIAAGEVGSRALHRNMWTPRVADPSAADFWGQVVSNALDEAVEDVVPEFVAWVATTVAGAFVDVTKMDHGLLHFEPRCWDARTQRPDLDPSLRLHYYGAIERGSSDEHFIARDRGTGRIEGHWDLPIGSAILGINLSREIRQATESFGASGTVEVPSMVVRWEPQRQRVAPGDQVTLRISVDRAHDGRVQLDDPLGQTNGVVDAGSTHTITYQVPADWDGTPIPITALSLSDQGLRAPSHPAFRGPIERIAWLVADDDELYLQPSSSCIEVGGTQQFRVSDAPLGGDPVDVTWSADGGSITDAGAFTAPSSPGEVTITATATDGSGREASVQVEVGDCAVCHWSVSVDGELYNVSHPSASGTWIQLLGMDWETGAFSGIELLTHNEPEAQRIVLVDPDRQPSTAARRPMQVTDHPWTVRDIAGGIFAPREDGDSLSWLIERSAAEIAGWELSSAQASLDHSFDRMERSREGHLQIEPHASIPMSGRVTGPVMIGRQITGTVDGASPANTTGFEGEAIYGQITVRIEGMFRPPFKDLPNPDLVIGPGMAGSDEPVAIRTFEMDADYAWCGGPFAESFEAGLEGGPDGVPELPDVPDLPSPPSDLEDRGPGAPLPPLPPLPPRG